MQKAKAKGLNKDEAVRYLEQRRRILRIKRDLCSNEIEKRRLSLALAEAVKKLDKLSEIPGLRKAVTDLETM